MKKRAEKPSQGFSKISFQFLCSDLSLLNPLVILIEKSTKGDTN